MTEDELIARLLVPLAGEPAHGLGDDCAHIPSSVLERGAIITLDTLVAGVHFFADDPPDLIARKALRVNLSDLAGKGARPAGYFLSLAIPSTVDEDWLRAFIAGLAADQSEFELALWGGDTVSTPGPFSVSITAVGLPTRDTPVLRSGGRPGDAVFVSGRIGDAALGLRLRQDPDAGSGLTGTERAFLLDQYLLPLPRVGLVAAIEGPLSASMDISDGLVLDLTRLCRQSRCGARIAAGAVPFSAAARRLLDVEPDLIETALTGGDDYEILFAAPADNADELEAAGSIGGVPVTRIGNLVEGDTVMVADADGNLMTFKNSGHQHLS